MTPQDQEILTIAEHLQQDCHQTVEVIMYEKKNATVQDATNVWMYRKLAEMELRIRQLELIVIP
jgi:hypothetical protein